MQRAASTAGLVFMDLSALGYRDRRWHTTNAGGLASVTATWRAGGRARRRAPDGTVLRWHSRVRRDNTGHDLPALFVGAEGNSWGYHRAGSAAALPTPSHRVTAVCGFAELAALVDAECSKDAGGHGVGITDGRAAALTREHLGVRPRRG